MFQINLYIQNIIICNVETTLKMIEMRKHIIPLMGEAQENLDLVCLCVINKSTRNHNGNIRRI